MYKLFANKIGCAIMNVIFEFYEVKQVEIVIRKYEELSVATCIRCGKPAKYFSTGWISPFCEKCKNKYPGRYTLIKLNEQ